MFLRNHGLVAVGRTVEEAFTRIYHTVLACESQVTMMSAGLDNLIIVSEEAKQRSMVHIIDVIFMTACFLVCVLLFTHSCWICGSCVQHRK